MIKIPYFINVQGLGTAFQNDILAFIVSRLYRMSCKRAIRVFFENIENANEFIRRRIVTKEKVTVLSGAGVNLDYYDYVPYQKHEEVRFLYLGRIMKEKGIDELFYAIQRLYNKYGAKIKLDLVGFFEDEYKDIVDQLIKDGVVEFHGFQEDPRPFYANADCIVLPSYHEGMSNVLLEAAATGRCIVTSDIPGCREAVDENISGFICAVKDKESLLHEMERVVLCDKTKLADMGNYGRKKMQKEFNKQDVVNRTVSLIYEGVKS